MLRRLRPVPACAILIIASGSAAFAADLEPPPPVSKAPVYKAPVVSGPYNWTGFYVGANVGYGWGSAGSDVASAGGPAFGGDLNADNPDPFPAFPHSDSLKLNGPNGGGQIGYNWQFTRSGVVGIEADFQANQTRNNNGLTDTFTLSDHADNSTILSGTVVTNHEAKMSWFGTVRGRLGYAMDNVLFYGTGGLAYGKVGVSGTSSSTLSSIVLDGNNAPPVVTTGATSFSEAAVNVGWTLGAGIEGAITGNWTWKAEYLHVDLGSLTVTAKAPTGVALTAKSDFTDEIVRVGVNYRFAPAVAAY